MSYNITAAPPPRSSPKDLASLARDDLDAALTGAREVALLMAPHHSNLGDAAIWTGTITLLDALGVQITYVATCGNYDAAELNRYHAKGPILLHGGGNFGDLYPYFDNARHRAIRDFPNRRIIQLPQSIYYQHGHGSPAATTGRQLLAKHEDVVVFAREHSSSAEARKTLGFELGISPDPAFALSPQLAAVGQEISADVPVLALLRTDSESFASAAGPEPGRGSASVDWPVENAIHRRLWREADQRDWALMQLWHAAIPRSMETVLPPAAAVGLVNRVQEARTLRAAHLLARGQVILTDRLHAALIGWMLGRAVVLLPNSYFKNRAMYETWLGDGSESGTDSAAPPQRVLWAGDVKSGHALALELSQS